MSVTFLGDGFPARLALVEISGNSSCCSSVRSGSVAGMRTPSVGRPHVIAVGASVLAGNSSVMGPGQWLSQNCFCVSVSGCIQCSIWRSWWMSRIKGLGDSRCLIAWMRWATLAEAIPLMPQSVSVGMSPTWLSRNLAQTSLVSLSGAGMMPAF